MGQLPVVYAGSFRQPLEGGDKNPPDFFVRAEKTVWIQTRTEKVPITMF
jgi:hypothetical protein